MDDLVTLAVLNTADHYAGLPAAGKAARKRTMTRLDRALKALKQ